MKKFIELLVLLNLVYATGVKVQYSQIEDSTTFGRDVSVYCGFLDQQNEFSSHLNHRQTPSLETYGVNLSYDYNYDQEWSPFIFINYENNTFISVDGTTVGTGIAYWPLRKQLEFPYCWKVSYAAIVDSNKGTIINSFRLKQWGYWNKIGWKLISFHKGYMHNINLTIKFKTYDWMNIVNRYYYVNSGGNSYYSSSWGVEVNL